MKPHEMRSWMTKEPAITQALAKGGVLFGAHGIISLNLADYPFPHWAKPEQTEEVERLICETLQQQRDVSWDKDPVRVNSLCDWERQLLTELEQLPEEARAGNPCTALVYDRKQTRVAVINGEEHLTMELFVDADEGQCLNTALCEALIMQDRVCCEMSAELAWDDDFLHLMSDPKKSGNGMSVACWMSLSALAKAGRMGEVDNMLQSHGIQYRPAFEAPGHEDADVFRLEAPMYGDRPLYESFPLLRKVVHRLCREENAERRLLISRKGSANEWSERLYAVLDGLKNGRVVTKEETPRLLSELRLGISLRKLHSKRTASTVCKALSQAHVRTTEGYMQLVPDETLPKDLDERRGECLRRLIEDQLQLTIV